MMLWGRGSTAWLVRHEMRIVWRGSSQAGWVRQLLAILLLLALPILGGIGLGVYLRAAPADPVDFHGYVAGGWVGLVILMLSGAGLHVLRVFHDRADFDLLLAAPLPPARILAAKSVAVWLTVALPMLVLSTPFLLTMAATGHPGWLGALVMVAIAAVIATALAFVLASQLLKLVGPRRARTLLQVFSGIIGLTVGLGGQASNLVPDLWNPFQDWLRRPPSAPWDSVAQAMFGAPLPLLAFIGIALLAAALSVRLAAAQLEAGRHEAVADHAPARFGGSPAWVLMAKEFRLLRRDPELLASVLLQLAYLIPAFGVIFFQGIVSPGRLAAAVVLLVGMVAGSLAWIVICGEDAPDLVAAAPLPERQIRTIKLAAACLPPLALAAPLVLWLLATAPRAGLSALLVAPVAALAAALLQSWVAKPLPRKAFRARQRGSILLALSEYALAIAWTGVVSQVYRGSVWVLLPLGIALLVLGVARSARPR